VTLFRIRWSTPADLPALTDVFARASLSNEGDRDALLAHVQDAAAIAVTRGFEGIAVTANPHAFFFYDALGFVVDGEIHTPFGPGRRMHLAFAGERS
jgi:hypothetical protein